MDVVYKIKASDRNEELRYSLRSLANLPHDRVWLAGHTPPWVTGVGEIPVGKRQRGKYASSTQNVLAACRHPEVSERFWLFDDDFFVMRPVESVPTLHRGTMSEALADRRIGGPYRKGMQATTELLHRLGYPDPLCYELHIPLLVDKDGMADAIERGRGVTGLQQRSVYGNLCRIGGERADDVKVSTSTGRWDGTQPFLSTSDRSFALMPIGREIRRHFTQPCRYEKDRA